MAITFPGDCTHSGDHMEYLARLKEKLRLEHNVEGEKVRSGKISRAEFDAWLEADWEPRQRKMTAAWHVAKDKASGKTATPRWEPDTKLAAT